MSNPLQGSAEDRRRRRLAQAELTPEQRAAVEARRAYRETTEYQTDLARDIELYQAEYPPAIDHGLLESLTELRRERTRQGLSLTDMAERTGIDRATISKLENGKLTNPTIGTLRTYARALGGKLAWRLELVRSPAFPVAPEQRSGTNRESDIQGTSKPSCHPTAADKHRRILMNAPRFTFEEICSRVAGLRGSRVPSVTGRSSHRIVGVDPAKREYEIEYASGNRILVRMDDLYALYRELYARGSIDGTYVSDNVQRILGWKTWHAPGRALFAILPLVDDSIRSTGGALSLGIRSRAAAETTS
jgi:transcriptional regulator with XRE-family HTH domain